MTTRYGYREWISDVPGVKILLCPWFNPYEVYVYKVVEGTLWDVKGTIGILTRPLQPGSLGEGWNLLRFLFNHNSQFEDFWVMGVLLLRTPGLLY